MSNIHKLGNLTRDNINFPKHLTPEVIHSALYIHNAKDKAESMIRVEYIAKLVGDETMTYVMSQLILPKLMSDLKQSQEYSEWLENRNKKLN